MNQLFILTILLRLWFSITPISAPPASEAVVRAVLFSIYLTFLEPFVIGATCAWCLTSAILMTALLWLSITPARRALSVLRSS